MKLASARVASGRLIRSWTAAATAALLLMAPTVSWAAEGDADMATQAGIGVGSAFASLIYSPIKVMWATGGLLVGGLAYAFSAGDTEVLRAVLTPSVLGDYVVTTDHLRGERSLEFLGRAEPEEPQPAWETAAPSVPSDVAAAPEEHDTLSDGW